MKKLFCPGPVGVSVDTAELMVNTNLGHRSKEFEEVFESIKYMTLKLFRAENDYLCLPITGSATLGNEMAISSTMTSEDHVLLLSNGVFGDRIEEILQIYEIPYIKYKEDCEFSIDKIEDLMKTGTFTWVAMVHHETSKGILNPIERISKIAYKYGAKTMVDAVSSAGGDIIDLSNGCIKILTTTSGKAIGSYPGVALILISKDICSDSTNHKVRSEYLNLYKNIEFSERCNQSLHTPSTALFIALEAQLKKIVSRPNYNYERYSMMNSYIKSELLKLGIRTLLGEEVKTSITLTSFILDPDKYDVKKFVSNMDDRGYVLYLGKNDLEKKGVFQIANMGDLNMIDCYGLVDAIYKEINSDRSMRN